MKNIKENSVLILADNLTPFNPERLQKAIIDLYNKGYKDFYTPLSSEFERASAEIITSLNVFGVSNKYPNLNLKVVVEHFMDHLQLATSEDAKRFANILDSAHEVILRRSTKYATHFFNAVSVAYANCSLLLTNVDPAEMEITCQGDENIQIEDFPMFIIYNLATSNEMSIVNIFID